ncbi:MAG TPA: hypothetical protein VEU96_15905 [Bryobacteraceae bacterium]|nr:hypothetical protein [Bryobacteraceae bacterium]
MDFHGDAVLAQMERILASPEFANSGPAGGLLKLAVENALAGRTPMPWKPTDESRDMQSRLAAFNARAGKDAPVLIELSEGECRFSVQTKAPERAPGYQPSPGRKLFMFALCLIALIGLWLYYWLAVK